MIKYAVIREVTERLISSTRSSTMDHQQVSARASKTDQSCTLTGTVQTAALDSSSEIRL